MVHPLRLREYILPPLGLLLEYPHQRIYLLLVRARLESIFLHHYREEDDRGSAVWRGERVLDHVVRVLWNRLDEHLARVVPAGGLLAKAEEIYHHACLGSGALVGPVETPGDAAFGESMDFLRGEWEAVVPVVLRVLGVPLWKRRYVCVRWVDALRWVMSASQNLWHRDREAHVEETGSRGRRDRWRL